METNHTNPFLGWGTKKCHVAHRKLLFKSLIIYKIYKVSKNINIKLISKKFGILHL